jgi:hypothetical protein
MRNRESTVCVTCRSQVSHQSGFQDLKGLLCDQLETSGPSSIKFLRYICQMRSVGKLIAPTKRIRIGFKFGVVERTDRKTRFRAKAFRSQGQNRCMKRCKICLMLSMKKFSKKRVNSDLELHQLVALEGREDISVQGNNQPLFLKHRE